MAWTYLMCFLKDEPLGCQLGQAQLHIQVQDISDMVILVGDKEYLNLCASDL